ncbi:hypothetical protein Bhyg_07081 [Pseudolycoriella hygida]|uniref:Uncharacterized protein n=1 Tax=Pseudolycoriella hygida TaxID=35572 RepID=A0A9Q0S2H4_9DIPT|nr:hypothetical protein Bhyg_07081 [Pseudolycoriella hygida]
MTQGCLHKIIERKMAINKTILVTLALMCFVSVVRTAIHCQSQCPNGNTYCAPYGLQCPSGYRSILWDTGCSCSNGSCQRCCITCGAADPENAFNSTDTA